MILAEKLNFGDKIGIIAPSAPVTSDYRENLYKGVKILSDYGFEIELSQNIFANSLNYSASPEERVADLHHMFQNKEIKAIICAQGGNTANSLLSAIDWNIIKENPKIFMGFSDITVLLNAIYQKTGLLTFHGHDIIWTIGKNPTDYDKSEFINRFVNKEFSILPSSKPRKTICSGKASGILIGGNLRCLLKLSGTDYMPSFDGKILLLEGMLDNLELVDSLLTQMVHQGIFDKIKGIITGYIEGFDHKDNITTIFEDILLTKLGNRGIPVLKAPDFGHKTPNTVLPIGAEIEFDANKKNIRIIGEFLR